MVRNLLYRDKCFWKVLEEISRLINTFLSKFKALLLLHDVKMYLISPVISIDKQWFPSIWQRVGVDCKTVVLGGDKRLLVEKV